MVVKFERRNGYKLEVVRGDAVYQQNREKRSILLLTDIHNYTIMRDYYISHVIIR